MINMPKSEMWLVDAINSYGYKESVIETGIEKSKKTR